VDFTAWLVAHQNFVYALIEVEALAGGTSGHVGEDQRVQDRRVLLFVHSQLSREPTLLSLVHRAGVMSDEPNQSVRRVERSQMPGTVERMEPGVAQLGGVPDVMQPGRRDEQGPLVLGQSLRGFYGPGSDSLCV
jgi:hypothetical protein